MSGNEKSVKEQIALLKAAIARKKMEAQPNIHRTTLQPQTNTHQPYYSRESNWRGRGRGRGRGGAPSFGNKTLQVVGSLTHVSPSIPPPSVPAASAISSRNKTLVLNKSVETAPAPKSIPQFITSGNKLVRAGVVIKKVPDLNDSYKVFKGGITKVFRKPPSKPTFAKSLRGGKRQVMIDGVAFRIDPHGRKLVRVNTEKPGLTSGIPQTSAVPPSFKATPKRVLIGKRAFVRSKKGNLIPQKTHCLYYQRGKCNLALKCPFIHDPTLRLICRKYLSPAGCPVHPCPLSHTPTPHTTPLCHHFASKRGCSNASCKYTHVKPKPNAGVCVAFSRDGYCSNGADCADRHVWVCPDVDAGKICSKGVKCRLPPCILVRKGVDVSKYMKKKDVAAEEEEEEDEMAALVKPDFVVGFQARKARAVYDGEEAEFDPSLVELDGESSEDDEDGSDQNGDVVNDGDVIDLEWDDSWDMQDAFTAGVQDEEEGDQEEEEEDEDEEEDDEDAADADAMENE
ncbi:hypothetical protein HDU80_004458 [Chytriomyces hyalinus]|nr:hypothetical protein HDU80_004458 [Chytriomyces hyalinus]